MYNYTHIITYYSNSLRYVIAHYHSLMFDDYLGVKSIFGQADTLDKHTLRVCGQEIIGSKRKLQKVVEGCFSFSK